MPNILDLQSLVTESAWESGNSHEHGSTASLRDCPRYQADGFAG